MNTRYDKETLLELKEIQAPLKNTSEVDFNRDMTVGLLTRQYAVTDANSAKPILGIIGAFSCIALILYDTENKTAVAAHLDVAANHDLTQLIKHLSPQTTIAHLAGGVGDLDGDNSSQKYCLEVVNFLKNNNIRIENADIIREINPNGTSIDDIPSLAIDARTGNIYSPVTHLQLELSINRMKYLTNGFQSWNNIPLTLCYSSKNKSVNSEPNSLLVKKPETIHLPFFKTSANTPKKNDQTYCGFKPGFL